MESNVEFANSSYLINLRIDAWTVSSIKSYTITTKNIFYDLNTLFVLHKNNKILCLFIKH